MSIRNLERLFRPASIAAIGASDRPGSVGATLMCNLLAGGFKGRIMPVNPAHGQVAGLPAFPDVASLPQAPDLAVICTPAAAVPEIVGALGRRGTRAAVVLSAGLGTPAPDGRTWRQQMLDAARPHLLRILGPNCVGLLVPGIGLNASFAHTGAAPGKLAFVAQSGALTTALLDWAQSRDIGFSHFVSLGDAADVDFGDMLDYLAGDVHTSAILLYIESITHARKFMSAGRAAARNKPVIAVKSGRTADAARAAASHTGAMAGADDVYDAALRRAGILRVDSTLELFDAAQTLALARPFSGDRLAILTNGGGPGVLATDALVRGGGRPAALSGSTVTGLDRLLPANWSHANPVDIVGDAPPERHAQALRLLLDDPQADAVLFIHAPTAIAPADAVARACLPAIFASRRSVFTCWLGGTAAEAARRRFAGAGLPAYETPEEAVEAFLQIVRYRRNQALLLETPSATAILPESAVAVARTIVKAALAAGRRMLDVVQTTQLLRACEIPVVPATAAPTVEAAVAAATATGFPVALKILSPDISHKSDVGGVALDLASAQAVEAAANAMLASVRQERPDARLDGFVVQPMARRAQSRELIVGAATDPTFGPVILFGEGGTDVERIADTAIALPPLNNVLADELIDRTRVARLLPAYRGREAARREPLRDLLIRISQLVAQVPEIRELDLNPVVAGPAGVVALDARISLAPAATTDCLAIRPYPDELESVATIGERRLLLRPVRPEDASGLGRLVESCDAQDRHFRFFRPVAAMPPSGLARYTQIDYDREMAFVAIDADGTLLGEARAMADPDNERAEFAILVASGFRNHGLGYALMQKLIAYCRRRGTRMLYGDVMTGNLRMLELASECGFEQEGYPVDGVIRIALALNVPTLEAA